MTKPTEEQIKALKPGDRVLVEVTFVRWANVYGDDRPYCRTDGQPEGHCGAVEPAAIHSILPREIRVGDKVRHKISGADGEVLFIDGGYAFVRAEDGHFVPPVADLEVIA